MSITLSEEVYQGRLSVVGRRKISACLEKLALSHVLGGELAAGYKAMAEDAERESEALAWSEDLIGEVNHAPR